MTATGPRGAEEMAIWPGTAPGSENVAADPEVIDPFQERFFAFALGYV